jgi:hypothetical protein
MSRPSFTTARGPHPLDEQRVLVASAGGRSGRRTEHALLAPSSDGPIPAAAAVLERRIAHGLLTGLAGPGESVGRVTR